MPAEPPLEHWLTGLPVPSTADLTRTVVVENPDLLPRLRSSGLVDGSSRLFVRSATDDQPDDRSPHLNAYRGTFSGNDAKLVFDNGYQLDSRPYGAGEFLSYDSQTVLRITDADDFSSYLRDADRAWLSGQFPDHLTHPNVIISDLAGLGGPAEHGGPQLRLFVFPDATVSTSPTGAELGTTDDDLDLLDDRWRAANLASSYPDAVCLDRVISDADRTAALLERPWIGRYLLIVDVIRIVRREHRFPGRISGFGGRISAGLPAPEQPDPLGAPVLLQVGHTVQAHDPVAGVGLVITATALAVVESVLAHEQLGQAAQWCDTHLELGPGRFPDLLLDTLGLLSGAGIAALWSDEAAARMGGTRTPTGTGSAPVTARNSETASTTQRRGAGIGPP